MKFYPIQRVAYDLSVRSLQSASRLTTDTFEEKDSGETPTFVQRVLGSTWDRVLIVALLVIGLVVWMKSGKPAGNTALQTAAQQTALVTIAAAGDGPGGETASVKLDANVPLIVTAPRGPRSADDIFNQVSQSVVRINVASASGSLVASGSGVVIGPGSVITNCHVALRGDLLEVKLAGVTYTASVEVANEEGDLCLLDVSGLSAPAVSLGRVDSVRVGQPVYAIAAPRGLYSTISDGIVSALREVQGSKMIQTSAPVSPGSSGGGLFDTNGRMIGVVTLQTKAGQNLNFAVPADWVGEMRSR